MLNIVLVEPEIPENTGNISRTCSVTGARLHLVRPLGFSVDDKHLKRAGLDYWQYLDITYYDSFEEVEEKNPDARFFLLSTHATRSYADAEYRDGDFLVFGKETKGLPEELTAAHFDRSVRIPMLSDKRSLNLSNSAAIAVYEVLRQTHFEGMKTDGEVLAARAEIQ